MRLTDSQIDEIKGRVDLADLAQQLGATLRRAGGRVVGSCPMCGGGRRATRFEVKRDYYVCAVCCEGGDAIALLRKATGCDFASAIERLGGPRALTSEEERKLEAERMARERVKQNEANAYRERERAACRRIWSLGTAQTPERLGRYLKARGVMLPASALVREACDIAYFEGQEDDGTGRMRPRCLMRGPAMLAQMLDNDGQPAGLHITYLTPDWTAKALVFDPDTGEALPAKKMRGTKAATRIILRDGGANPERLFLAEGIETALSVAVALKACGRLRVNDAFWAAGDLGNIGGPHLGTVPHPIDKTPAGRAKRIPGPEPDREAAALTLPATLRTLVLLGDGDSEPFLTRTTLARARARYQRPGLAIATVMAPEGKDFNDMIRGGA